ncbi:MAG: type II and III secretion system protein [Candidatus Hydrogenedentes bacterium]|nr:type II and III secretion system protein [Candidatus Hydrogenedentota bacterium]
MNRRALYVTAALALVCAAGALAEEAAPAPEPTYTSIKQVQIQVWISQTDEDGTRDLGSNLNYTRFTRDQEHSGSVERIRTNTFDPMGATFDATLPAPDYDAYTRDGSGNVRLTPESATAWTAANTLAAGASGEPYVATRSGAGLSWSIVDADRGTIDGVFRAIETRTDSDLISKPELLVIDKTQATINAGDEIPYQSVAYKNGVPQLSITWRQIGVEMDLMPEIASDDLVKLTITKLDVSDNLKDTPIEGLQVPVFSTRSQTGVVMVPNAQTLVIGGLNSRIERRTETRVPIIGQIPLLGLLFRGRHSEALNSHLLIFVSPTVVDLRDYSDRMDRALNFWREEKWQNMDRIQQEIDLMPKEL